MSKKKITDNDVTEFEYLDPDRVDAVSAPANGISFLMLKSIDNPGRAPAPATRPRKEKKAMKKAERNATVQAAKSAAETGTLAKGTARGAILTALDRLDKAAKAARAAGEIATYRDIRREMLVTKWSLRQRSADHDAAALRKQTFGFGTPLFSSTTTHGLAADDPDIGFGPAPRR